MTPRKLVLNECAYCHIGTTALLTNDHRIPDWFVKRAHMFGLDLDLDFHFGGRRNIMRVCGPCNSKKAWTFDYRDPFTREFFRIFIDKLEEKMKNSELGTSPIGRKIQQ